MRSLFIPQIFYKSGRLRIAITTANLVPLDWRDIENVGFKRKLTSYTLNSLHFCECSRPLGYRIFPYALHQSKETSEHKTSRAILRRH